MDKKNDSQNHYVGKENDGGRKRGTQGNIKEQYKRKGSSPSIGKTRWINMGRRQSSVHGRKNLCTKQQKNQGGNTEGKS